MPLTSRPWCDTCGATPKADTHPDCPGCRFILGLPRGRNNRGPLTRQTLINRMKGNEHRARGPRCGVIAASGVACSRYSTGPCRWHNQTKTSKVA